MRPCLVSSLRAVAGELLQSKRKRASTDFENVLPTVSSCESLAKGAKPMGESSISRSALHKACRRGKNLTVAEVQEILKADPDAAFRPVRLTTAKTVYNRKTGLLETKLVQEPYKYALNLAISYKVAAEVLELLISSAPTILSLRDNKSCSLHILLKHKPDDASTIDAVLLSRPEACSWTCSYDNTALHVAVRHGASLSTIRHMVTVYPQALQMRNFSRDSPLDLAQRSILTKYDDVVDYLTEQTHNFHGD